MLTQSNPGLGGERRAHHSGDGRAAALSASSAARAWRLLYDGYPEKVYVIGNGTMRGK